MKKYKFPQFNIEIIDPTIEVIRVSNHLPSKTCDVDILLTTDTTKFSVNLQGFTYDLQCENYEIENWVFNVELPKYEI